MLSNTSMPVIRATLPLLESRLSSITQRFYEALFTEHPALLGTVFARSRQRTDQQAEALASSIAVFARWLLDNPDSLPESLLRRIAHRHASVGVTREQYQVVHDHLFAAIVDELGEAVTPAVAAAWEEVYWLMADALLSIETGLASSLGGLPLWAEWRVVSVTSAGSEAVTIVLEADHGDSVAGRAGQFVSTRVHLPDGSSDVRQYSLSGTAASPTRREITVGRVDDGAVSRYLNDELAIGDRLQMSQPFGAITLDDDDSPLLLVSGGIGCTPLAAMLRSIADGDHARRVVVVHLDSDEDRWALRSQMRADAERAGATLIEWYSRAEGKRIDLSSLPFEHGMTVYTCGPIGLMRSVREHALAAGLAPSRVRYEVFGSEA